MSEDPKRGAPPVRCFYCLDETVSIGVCLDCRSKLEAARDENRRLKRDLDLSQRRYWSLMREHQRCMRRR